MGEKKGLDWKFIIVCSLLVVVLIQIIKLRGGY